MAAVTVARGPAALSRCRAIAGGGVLLLLAGCTLGPDFVRPVTAGPERYGRDALLAQTVPAEGGVQHLLAGADLPAEWWTLFKSPRLDVQVRAALAANPTLQAAEASLRQSQDRLQAGKGVFYPQLALAGSAVRERSAPVQQGGQGGLGIFNLLTLNGTISYALDVFGGERRGVEGLQAQADQQSCLVRAAYLTLTATVVDTIIGRAAYAEQRRATEQLIALQEGQVQAADNAYRAGIGTYANVLALRSLRASNQALLPALRQRVAEADHLLATLGGSLPAEAGATAIELSELSLPLDVPVSLPSALVHRRPDILAAEQAMHAASAGIGVATAAMYPAISLDAAYGSAATRFAGLSAASARFWSIGPAVSLPVFQGGRLWYGRQGAIDAWQQTQAEYRQTVLSAFAQVADSLDALDNDARILQARDSAWDAAGESLALLDANQRAGTIAFVDVLAGDVLYHQAAVARLQTLAQRYQDTVALFVALGGGWWNAPGSQAAGSAP